MANATTSSAHAFLPATIQHTVRNFLSEDVPAYDFDCKIITSNISYTQLLQHGIWSQPMYQASELIWQIGIPILVVTGTFGNAMIILLQGRLSGSQDDLSMPVFFVCLAVSDLLSLWCDAVFWWLDACGLKMSESDEVACKVRVFLAYTTGHTSAWTLVIMTFQRAGSILWPHRIHALCSQRLAVTLMCLQVAFLALVNAHALYGHTTIAADNGTVAECYFTFVSEDYRAFFNGAWGWIDTSISSIAPFVLLVAANVVLVRKVSQSVQEAKQRLAVCQSRAANIRSKRVSSITATLVSTSLEFLVLTGPASVYMMFEETFSRGAEEDVTIAAANELALAVSGVLLFANNAANFYVYCLTGSRFREEFLNLVSYWSKQLKRVDGRVEGPRTALSVVEDYSVKVNISREATHKC